MHENYSIDTPPVEPLSPHVIYSPITVNEDYNNHSESQGFVIFCHAWKT